MKKKTVFKTLKKTGVVPVLRTDSEKNVLAAVAALIDGGIAVAEITLTIPNAIRVIENCIDRFGNRVILGAGSVTQAQACENAIKAGCRFIVTPTVKTEVIAVCRRADVCVIGGGLTPTEILNSWEAGADAVKVFPAKAVGGPTYIRMIHDPLPEIPLVPTGGVNLETLVEYIHAGAEFIGAGGDLAGKALIESGKTEQISTRARQYTAAIQKARR
jgi:2-dehydro-3-deoxyphosphogluconate aldolase/(4S)-4-hydroxy-2-oxoglutarate aldolase